MSIFGNIMDKIRGSAARAQAAASPPTGVSEVNPGGAAITAAAAPAAAMSSFDVSARLEEMASASSQKLDWKSSIVDLMKLVGIDSSMTNRKALAHELGFPGDTNDSASMNVWLHKAVMQKLAENGGTVPASLLD
ncbi:MAG: DUF3597 domain-containing protein [bacterium]